MAGSFVPLSLLSKGIGQVSKNGHERLDVYLEPEDYYNLESKYHHQLEALRHKALQSGSVKSVKEVPLHKTFLTRKGALLLFSEELANKASEEEEARLQRVAKKKRVTFWEDAYRIPDEEEEAETKEDFQNDALKTCHDLSWAILNYGKKLDYRKKGDDLYLRFLHDANTISGRKIRPGFSPKRYISTWSRYWNEDMLQKMRHSGMISDKTLYRQNPLLPHLYKYATYNLSSNPPPYRVTKNMLLPTGNVPSYEFYRVKGKQPPQSNSDTLETRSKAPPPSQQDAPPAPQGVIHAVKYHDTGEIQEVTYSELKPQEKQEILAELLIAAHEHQQHIRDTLELVLSSNRPQERGSERPGSSSAASELMADMHRAILSLVESPVRQQMKERQRLIQEQEEKQLELQRQQQIKEEKRLLKEEQRMKRKLKRQEKKKAEEAKLIPVKPPTPEKRKEEKRNEEKPKDVEAKVEDHVDAAKEEEHKKKEERRRKRREEREERRRLREEKAIQEEKKKAEKMKMEEERPPFRDEQRHQVEKQDEEKHHRRHRRHKGRENKQEEEATEKTQDKHRKHKEHQPSLQQPMVYVSTEAVPSRQGIIDTQYTGHSDVINEDDGTYIIVQPQQPGVATEIKQRGEARQSLKRRDATIHPGLVPLQAPANTPATGIPQHPRSHRKIEYEEIVVTDQRRESRTSSNSDINAALIAAGNNSYVRKTSLDGSVQKKKAKSVVSSHSSDRKPKLFEAVLPGDDLSQKQNSSFYGGAMPITSNLVKQTLSDKVSILSASQPGTESISGHSGSYRHDATKTPRHSIGGPSIASKGRRQSDSKVSEPVVPLIGVEPATPLHPVQASPHQLTPQPKKQYLSPGNSLSGSHRSSHKSSQRSIGGQSLQGSSGGQKSQRSLGGQEESFGGQGSEKGLQYSNSDRESKRRPSKKSDGSDNDESDNSDDLSKSSQSSDQKSSKHEVASKYSQTTKSKSKPGSIYSDESASLLSKKQSIESKVEAPYYGLKGAKGPGSQSSSSILKSTSSKKSKSTRGSIPSAMKRDRHTASVRMPDGKIVPVGGSLARSSDKELTEVSESEEEVQSSKLTSEIITQIRPKPAIKSGKSSEITSQNESSTRSDLKVTFKRDDVATDTEDEDVTPIHEEDYDVTEEEEEQEQEWPDVKEEVVSIVKSATSSSSSRPISSRSDILTAHARKVAAKVIKKQRPKSGLDEDAKQAAELWNKALSSSEEKSESEEETEEEEEEWGVKEQSTAVSSVKVESQHVLDEKKNRLKKIINEGKKEREIRPSVSTATPTKKQPSVTASMTSQSSAPSSVSSVQEEFVAEIQKKASDLGIEAKELTFEADVIDKLEKSDIKPEEVEVFHDKEAGRHIVRSRHSSATASSVLTPSSEEPGEQSDYEEATKKKQKLVVDLKIEDKAPESISRASSISTSVSSHSYQRTARSRSSSISPERKRPSIPVEKSQVVLDYDVTTYEGKLGDPKTEEPTIQSGRPHVEPEKIKVTTDRAQKLDEKDKSLADLRKTSDLTSKKGKPGQKLLNNVPGAASVAESVNSEKSSSKGTKAKPVTKGPQRAGKPGVKQAVGKASIDSKGEVDSVKEELTEEEKLQRDLAKLTDGQKTKKADGKRKKGAKGKSKAVDSVASEKDSSITSKTPEKAKTKTPEKLAAKTPETPFRAGQPDKKKQIEEPLPAATPDEKAESIASSKPKKSQKGKKKEPVTQVQISQSEKPAAQSLETEEKPEKIQSAKSLSPNKGGEEEEEYSSPVESPVDDYVFVRKEDTPEPTPDPTPEPAEPEVKMDDTKSQISEVTEATEATEASSQAAIAAAEDEAEREAKKAAKAEREAKRAAAAERRRLEVERKRKEKEEQIRKEKEELERKEQMKEEFEAEGRRREEAAKLRKEEAEKAKQREVEEEENRKRRLEIQQERERKQLEEKRRKIEEIQRKKREEEERRKEEARLRALEEEQKRKEEEELMAQMEEDEREQYAERKRIEEEERKVREEERRRREQEEARIMMEQAKLQAIARAKQQAEVEEKLRFIREFFQEAQGLDNTQNVNRSFTFSYFELMQMLGLDVPVE